MEKLFDRAGEYDSMLGKGLRLFGESKSYLIVQRIASALKDMPEGYAPQRILDYGCGSGDVTRYLGELFPKASVIGADVSDAVLSYARSRTGTGLVQFISVDSIAGCEPFDMCHINGVFHHIDPKKRSAVMKGICNKMEQGGHLFFFENNPWNPGTRIAMSRIPFDKDAVMLNHIQTRSLLVDCGFTNIKSLRFLFFFPRFLGFLRGVEPYLENVPMGAQYGVVAQKG